MFLSLPCTNESTNNGAARENKLQLQDLGGRGCGCCQRTTARKTPAISTQRCSCQKLAHPCPTLGQLLDTPFCTCFWSEKKQHEIARARFCTQSCSKVGQLLVHSSPTPHPMESCSGLPRNSPLATPERCGRKRMWEETGGILFREYCFGEENSLSLTEFYGKLGECCEKLGEFALAQK